MSTVNAKLAERGSVVEGLAPITPSTSTPDYVSLKNAVRLSVIIQTNNATTVTGSAITLKQATAVAGTGEKALAFSLVAKNEDTATSDALVDTAVTSDTFTTVATNNLNGLYVIDVDPASLDVDGGFDCVRAGTGDATAQVVSVVYVLDGKYGTAIGDAASSITD